MKTLITLVAFLMLLGSCKQSTNSETSKDFGIFYGRYDVSDSIIFHIQSDGSNVTGTFWESRLGQPYNPDADRPIRGTITRMDSVIEIEGGIDFDSYLPTGHDTIVIHSHTDISIGIRNNGNDAFILFHPKGGAYGTGFAHKR